MYAFFFILLNVIAWGCLISNRGYVVILGIICASILMLLPFQGDIVYTIQHQGNQIYNATTINGSQKIYTNAVTQFNDNQTITIMHFTTTDYTIFTYLVLLLEIVLVFRWYSLNYEWGEKAKLG